MKLEFPSLPFAVSDQRYHRNTFKPFPVAQKTLLDKLFPACFTLKASKFLIKSLKRVFVTWSSVGLEDVPKIQSGSSSVEQRSCGNGRRGAAACCEPKERLEDEGEAR